MPCGQTNIPCPHVLITLPAGVSSTTGGSVRVNTKTVPFGSIATVRHLAPLQGSGELSPAGHSLIGGGSGEPAPLQRVNGNEGNAEGNAARHGTHTLKRHGDLPVDSLPPPVGGSEVRLRFCRLRTPLDHKQLERPWHDRRSC